MKLKILATGVAMALGLSLSVPAQAAVQTMRFQDDDIDFAGALVDGEWVPYLTQDLAVGDIHVAVFEIPTHTIGGNNAIPAGQELTGIAVTQIYGIQDNGGIGNIYQFGPYSGGMNAILQLADESLTVDQGGAGQGAMVAMWLNGTSGAGGDIDLSVEANGNQPNCTSLANCVGQASLGDLYQVDGMPYSIIENLFVPDDADNLWVGIQTATEGGNYGDILAASASLPIATIIGQLDNIFNAVGPILYQDDTSGNLCTPQPAGPAADDCVQVTFSGQIKGGNQSEVGQLNNGAFAFSDFDGDKLLAVPEPGTVALLSMGLLGVFGFARRRV